MRAKNDFCQPRYWCIFIILSTNKKTRRSGLSAGALRMPDTSEVARDFSPARSLTPQVRKL
ncbi:hypothetical protein B9N39_20545 [Escherichia coli]|nr:hypothetical protein B9N39_20545 [Escherichia coli]RBT87978.1 hypothetical protein B9N38_21910 [Escherichia coli]